MQKKAEIQRGTCFFLIIASFLSAYGSGPALTNTAWTQACSLAQTLDKVPGITKGKLQKISDGTNGAERAVLKLLIMAAQAPDRKEKVAYRSLAKTIATSGDGLKAKLKSTMAGAIEATAQAANLAGQINEFVTFLDAAAKDGSETGGCLAESGNGNIAEHAAIARAGCRKGAPAYQATENSLTAEEFSQSGFPKASGVPDAKDANANNKCILFQNGGTPATGRFYQHQDKVTHLNGYIEITSGGGGTTIALKSLAAIAKSGVHKNGERLAELYTPLATLNAADTTEVKTTDETIIKSAATGNALARAVQEALKQTTPHEDDEKMKEEAADIIKEFVGSENPKGSKAWEKLKSTKVKGTEPNPETEKELKDITHNDKLVSALNYYISSAESKLQEAETRLAAAKTAADKVPTAPKPDECKAKKGDTCKDGCKWDSDGENKKCVVDPHFVKKEVEGGEKDSKTNTTASNSFLIHKAPLWLAFLLF